MYFSLLKTNYMPKFFIYYRYKTTEKRELNQKLQDNLKRKKKINCMPTTQVSPSQSPKIRRNIHKFGRYVFTGTIQHCIKDTPQAVMLLALECLTCDKLDDQNFIGKSHYFKSIRVKCVKLFCKFSFNLKHCGIWSYANGQNSKALFNLSLINQCFFLQSQLCA